MNFFCDKVTVANQQEKERHSVVECIRLYSGECWKKEDVEGRILVLLEGKVSFSQEIMQDKMIPKKHIFYSPPGSECEILAMEESHFIIFRLTTQKPFCKHFTMNNLRYKKHDFEEEFNLLPIKKELERFFYDLFMHTNNGLKSSCYHEIKMKELFILLGTYYERKEVASLFCPLLSQNIDFSAFILATYSDVKTIKDFADKANMSLPVFDKTFKKTFNMGASQWMKQKKMKRLLYEITCTSKPLKLLSSQCGFPSPSQLNEFCKKNFGKPPGQMRKQAKN